jgi:5-methyltetrahydropteroyltriglutamate--homocysteine methyltransferase
VHPHSDVVGSLLRPDYLRDAQGRLERGELTPAAYKTVEDRAVDEAVALQQDAGLDVVTDGEMRRYAFFGHLAEALEGFDKYAGWSLTFHDDEGHEAAVQRPVVVSRLKWRRQMSVEEFTYLRGRTSVPAKVTLLSAQQAAAYYDPDKSRGAYATLDAYLADLVDFTRREIAELKRLAEQADRRPAYGGPSTRRSARVTGSAAPTRTRCWRHPSNSTTRSSRATRVRLGIHICRGNFQSMFYASGGYDRIAGQVFGRSKFDRFLLEYDDERSGTFEPLRHVPDGRVVVLGLVSSKLARMEAPDTLKARIKDASAFVPLDRLALSPQCGFASTHEGNRISPEVQRQKLELVARTAREVWS